MVSPIFAVVAKRHASAAVEQASPLGGSLAIASSRSIKEMSHIGHSDNVTLSVGGRTRSFAYSGPTHLGMPGRLFDLFPHRLHFV